MPKLGGSEVLLSAALLMLCIVGFPKEGRADSVIVAAQVNEGSSPLDICSSGPGSISCNASGSLNAVGTVSASAFASLSTGTMGTSVVASGFGDSYQTDYAQARANSALVYGFHLPTALNGDTLLFDISVSGTNLSSCSGICSSNPVSSQFSAPLSYEHIVSNNNVIALSSGTTNFNVTTPITNGIAALEIELNSTLFCSISQSSVCNASSDFSDPLTITGAEIVDSAGNVVQGLPIVSDSGFNPNASSLPVNTPESSSISMLAIGLLAVAVLAVRRGKGAQVTVAKA